MQRKDMIGAIAREVASKAREEQRKGQSAESYWQALVETAITKYEAMKELVR